MKSISFLIVFVLSFTSYSQFDSLDQRIFQFEFDSVHFSIWDIYFKDFSGETEDSEINYSGLLKQVQLSKRKSKKLMTSLKDTSSYANERANLTHHDIVFEFYDSGSVVCRIEISAFTGNISIFNIPKEMEFYDKVSKSLGKQIERLMNDSKFIKQFEYDEIDLEGLRRSYI